VISGREEARLIYSGAAHSLAHDDADRLVFDIGGGSTECILGRNYEAIALESASIGCVLPVQPTFSRRRDRPGELRAGATGRARRIGVVLAGLSQPRLEMRGSGPRERPRHSGRPPRPCWASIG
jgi:exopolyphosphatase/guanosine-5'-triphosphate,3'-diphosphate pyrophosphatase